MLNAVMKHFRQMLWSAIWQSYFLEIYIIWCFVFMGVLKNPVFVRQITSAFLRCSVITNLFLSFSFVIIFHHTFPSSSLPSNRPFLVYTLLRNSYRFISLHPLIILWIYRTSSDKTKLILANKLSINLRSLFIFYFNTSLSNNDQTT
jgi:hypothetical protein